MTHVSWDLFSKRGAAFLVFLDVALTFKGLLLRIFRPRILAKYGKAKTPDRPQSIVFGFD